MTMLISYQLSVLIAVLAFVYTNLLTNSNQIFAGLYRFLYKKFKTESRIMSGRPYHPLFMVLIHCEKCVAGQVALWLYLYYHLNDYDFVQHILFISFTIFIAHIIQKLN